MTIMAPPMRLLPPCSPKWATRRRPERETFGPELARIAAALGQPFMPWQSAAADVGCEIDPETGLPAYREVIITVPRQSGKTTLYLTWQVNRCVSPRWAQPQRSAFTAQSGKDARDKWLDELFPLIRRSRALAPLVARIYEGMGNEYIRFTNGSLIRLLSTSTSSGHSKTLHQAVLDEIWHDADGRREQGLRPAMITITDAQLLICSTAGTAASVVLDRKVAQGRAAVAADSGSGTAYIEYSAPGGWDPADEDSYFGFMPALCPAPPCRCGRGAWRHTITMPAVRSERDSLEPQEFARAYGNIADPTGAGVPGPDLSAWAARGDRRSQISGTVALAFAVAPDGSSASIAVGGRRADGLGHGELTEPVRPGTAGLVDRLVKLAETWDPCVLVMNPAGAAGAFEKELLEHGFATAPPGKDPPPGKRRLQVVGPREYAQACGALAADVADDRWRHLGQGPLDDAVNGARTRPLTDAWAWSWGRSRANIGPLEAVTLARHGYMSHGLNAGAFFGSWR
jgi:Phage terminase large subunit gpA, ATPase domain